jgi:hypothetical protein
VAAGEEKMHHALVMNIFGSMINAMLPLMRREVWTATRVLLPILAGFTVELSFVLQPTHVGNLMLADSRQ